ncbi:SDR family NAD(P)-dependent oxidoreductase [Sphingomonas crocodyli]|uniref:SDR family oxidoreductase n=1 Tax=Sphingomonas crocodyli TaxID=1979270 RepID=A0A437M0K5_9SPHN|nr:SDR family NAD(P)-dependent oxidoreductase [Sphingomonas crocodyli]RVT91106.1 SDR family oxidoreductase [Sphingomonas crocodyli]
MDLRLAGKRALVTGSSGGIGAGVAEILAREGAAVVVHGRDTGRAEATAERIRAAGGKAAIACGDLATDAGGDAVADAALAAFGGIDILVNNAGGRSSDNGVADWLQAEGADWADTYQMNTVAAARLIRRLVPGMKERGWGRIIQVASAAGTSPSANSPQYAASKAAMINMTVSLSKALSRTGVTVNTISPGMIQTPAVDAWLDGIAEARGWPGDRAKSMAWVLDNAVHQTVDRMGMPEDIGNVIALVASPLGDFINGANFRVDGGNSPAVN